MWRRRRCGQREWPSDCTNLDAVVFVVEKGHGARVAVADELHQLRKRHAIAGRVEEVYNSVEKDKKKRSKHARAGDALRPAISGTASVSPSSSALWLV